MQFTCFIIIKFYEFIILFGTKQFPIKAQKELNKLETKQVPNNAQKESNILAKN